MSAPYTYPQFFYQTPYLYPFHNQPIITPFVPPCPLPPSPRGDAGGRRVRFEDEDPYPQTRPRPPSWYAGMPGTAPAPNPAPFPSPPMMYVPLPVPVAGPPPSYAHQRRRSDGAIPGMHPGWVPVPWMTYPYPQYPAPPPSQFHPLLNGEGQTPLLFFDLSIHAFNPLRVASPGSTTGKALTLEELQQQATYPGVTKMIITCDAIPQWPITLEPVDVNSNFLSVNRGANPQPITLGDVLVAIHRHLQTQISHRDWVKLSNDEATQIARAYTRRCRTFPSAESFEASQGVRKVDYLKDRYVFKGLTRRRGEDGFEYVKLLVGLR
ncbi:hypothetical protein QCA50_014856 [Cerrena zonata]|uniref:DUF6699 domain-containing protein n=1 Tax=Cerrena zonata TaxID=2478898 RepID=A0AAW0FUF4_9APHY